MIAIEDSLPGLTTATKQFYLDVLQHLSMSPKRLSSKYFYDKAGDQLFEKIMSSPDYYLTRAEMSIFKYRSEDISNSLLQQGDQPEVIELGPGNCAKSIHLLRALGARMDQLTFIPIDISENIITALQMTLPESIPNISVEGLTGEYFHQLAACGGSNDVKKVVLCLGGNIGNMSIEESHAFCRTLRSHLRPGDQCLIGFDLIKHPAIIKRAYDDRDGYTRAFNLTLLKRINTELNANFNIGQFDHYCSYDPIEGAAKSYLIALKNMTLNISGVDIHFKKDEPIWTEISQKFTQKQIHSMAAQNGFQHTDQFLDANGWFMDALWTAI